MSCAWIRVDLCTSPLQEEAVIQVVDAILEDVRLGLETSLPQLNRRRVAIVKYLGELYNYQLVEAGVIFRTLYAFISFGSNPDGGLNRMRERGRKG